jgi:hypothetical protein
MTTEILKIFGSYIHCYVVGSVDAANEFMERNVNFGILKADDENKKYYLAHMEDV